MSSNRHSINQGDGKPWYERVDQLLNRIQGMAGAALAAISGLQNRIQSIAASGAVVAAGGAITPPVQLVTTKVNAQLRISASFSGNLPAGTFTPFLTVQVDGGPVTTEVNWVQSTGPTTVDQSTVFEFSVVAPAGTPVTVNWVSTAGDGNLTLGNAAAPAPVAAALFVEELA